MIIFMTVLQQVIILLILIALGYLLAKKDILTATGVKSMTDTVLLFVTPCVIIKSFIRKFDHSTLRAILFSFAASVGIHLLFIVISRLIYRSRNDARQRILRFGIIFSNCGFMSLPLQEAVLGETGVLYGASFVAIFNLFVWSYGIADISGDREFFTPKKLLLNPGIIGLVAGFLIFVLSVPIPEVIAAPIGYLAALNTPLPMLIIGYHLAQSDLPAALKDLQCLFAMALRLVVLPLAALGVLYLCGLRGDLLVALVIAAAAPTAAITTMFADKFDKPTDLSVNLVSLSTVASLVTIPLLVTLAIVVA